MPTTMPPSISPRVVDHDATPARAADWRPPPQTGRGALAGAEAAIGSWLVVSVLAIAGYVATAASPELGSAGWLDAARIGSAIWLLGHGGSLTFEVATISLVPIGMTLVAIGGVAASMRRVHPTSWWPVAAAVITYTALAGGYAALAGMPGAWRGILGAPVVAAVGSLIAMAGRYPADLTAALRRVPQVVTAGLGAGVRALAALLALAVLVVVAALVLGLGQVRELHDALAPDGVSTVILIAAQLLLLPTLVVWAVSFLAGPGFAVGAGTAFTPSGIDAGPLPVVPVLGALPEPDSPVASMGFVVVLGVVVGALAGWWLRRSHPMSLAMTVVGAAIAAVTCGLAVLVLAWASAGAIGPGRMATVGPDPVATGIAVTWQVALGVGLVGVLSHPRTHEALRSVRSAAGSWWAQVRA